MVKLTRQEEISSTSKMIVLTHPLVCILPNRLYSVPIQIPLINTIAPHTILHESLSNTRCTIASPILLKNIKFQAKLGISNTPGRVQLLPSFNISLTLPYPTILVSESYPKRTLPPSNFLYSQNHSLCIVMW